MKKYVLYLAIVMMAPLTTMKGQNYASLWKQVEDAENKDLPKTEQQLLRQIAIKAETEKAYGHLLKAELQEARSLTAVSPDSLEPAVERLKQHAAQTQDAALRAVYNAVLGEIYRSNRSLDIDNYQQIADAFFDKALAEPEKLAAIKASAYEPFVKSGSDSKIFGNDLLSVIGYETGRYQPLRDYYIKSGNRRASLMASLELLEQERPDEYVPLNKSVYLQRLDSLVNEYADLTEAGEVAIRRYSYMDSQTDATAEQKWQYINYALEHWGAWQRMNILRNHLRDLTSLTFNASMAHQVNIPGHSQNIDLENLRGIHALTMRIYKVKADGNIEARPSSNDGYKKIKPLLTPMPEMTQTRHYVGKKAYETFTDSMTIDGLPTGVYMVEFESLPATKVVRQLYFVSDMRLLVQSLPDNKIRYVAVSGTTGQPVKNARLQLMTGFGKDRITTTVTTDEKGEYVYTYKDDRPHRLYLTSPSDKACPPMNGYGYFTYYEAQESTDHTVLYTDRKIYRPGQTVHVAAISYTTRHGYENQVNSGRSIRLQLRDANYEIVAEKQVTTDDFGTCTADFTLPSHGLTGVFSVSADDHTQYIHVEEYKRPTFEVVFPEVNQHYEDGDTVVVKATARSYAGVPVQGARVRYSVIRRQAFWWFTYSRYWSGGVIGTGSDEEIMARGEAITGTDGTFVVEMPMILPKTKYPMFYNFVVTADVTDQGGETHQGQLSLPLGNRKTAFSTTMPDKVLAEKVPQVMFNLRNAAGIDIAATLQYRIDNGKWTEANTNSQLSTLNAQLSTLKSGNHTLEAVCQGDSLKRDFVVFSLNDKHPATPTDDWFYLSAAQFPNDGQPVTLQVGSSAKDVHIVYTILAGNNIIEQGAANRSNELVNRKFTYKEEYGNGLLLTFAWVKEGKAYTHQATIQRPLPDKQLQLQWQTFRNRLTPGQEEEWSLVITAPAVPGKTADRTPAKAQLMATLYDKSLDQLAEHEWSLTPSCWLPTPSTNWSVPSWGSLSFYGSKHLGRLTTSGLDFTSFNHELYPSPYFYGRRTRLYKNVPVALMAKSSVSVTESDMADEDVLHEVVVGYGKMSDNANEEEKAEEDDYGMGPGDDGGETAVQLRENLNETAFFYPQLTADGNGLVTLKFTLPECLTTWRFLGIAHTQDMMYGTMTDEAIAKKDVMIQPNMPRFLRIGDKGSVSARIINTGEKTVSGTVRMQLIDPETEAIVSQRSQTVTLAPDSTASVSFDCQPQGDWNPLLIAKFTVSGKDFSDGEQHYLPILPNEERVTLTVPFTQNEPGTKTIDLTKLLPEHQSQSSNRNAKITVEYTNNPAWLMIQALPTIAQPSDDNAISQAASLYANAIGRHILEQNPNAKHVFEAWNHEQGNETSLMSNLQKNADLKDLLLNETPWVMDANHEKEQKQRLADFFDENLMSHRLTTATGKLAALQLSDGSWSWWKGMVGSTYMTVEICEMLVRLNQMVGHQEETENMLESAFKYLGKEAVELVDEMKKEEKKGHKQVFPSHKALQWLYVCAIDGRPLPAKVQAANDYLKNLLKKDTKNQTIYDKALSAIILNSKTYIKSLKEYTVYKEEMGRYYDTQRASYSWRDYRIPTQVAAIEAIQRLTPDDTQTITEMRRWLLQEKRTQAWDTPINSTDAVYAFLNGNASELKAQEKTVLAVDGKAIETSSATAGIGYIKATVPAEHVKTFTAQKTSTGTSWGAVYAQFMQPTAEISDQKSGISIKREIMRAEANSTLSTQHSTLNTLHSTLKVGDRIKVRLTIEADRDYDFVQVVDKRAACLEPVSQLSGYHHYYYIAPKDYTTNYYFDVLSKGKHVIETEYYVDRTGQYETGTCTVGCAYSPEFRGLTKSRTITVE